MAVILNQHTVGNILIISCDVNPITSGGLVAPKGSMANAIDGSGTFYKFSTGNTDWISTFQGAQLTTSVDGLGSTLQVGSLGFSCPYYNGTIQSWNLIGDFGATGDAVIDIKKNGVSMVGAGNKPTITTANSNSEVVSGWTTLSFVAGDYIEWYLESVSTFKTLNGFLNISR